MMEEGRKHGSGMSMWDHCLTFPIWILVMNPRKVVGIAMDNLLCQVCNQWCDCTQGSKGKEIKTS